MDLFSPIRFDDLALTLARPHATERPIHDDGIDLALKLLLHLRALQRRLLVTVLTVDDAGLEVQEILCAEVLPGQLQGLTPTTFRPTCLLLILTTRIARRRGGRLTNRLFERLLDIVKRLLELLLDLLVLLVDLIILGVCLGLEFLLCLLQLLRRLLLGLLRLPLRFREGLGRHHGPYMISEFYLDYV